MRKFITSKKMLTAAIATGLLFSAGAPFASAMPSGGKVLTGNAGATIDGTWTTDNLNLTDWSQLSAWAGSGKAAVIQWDSFDIEAGKNISIAATSSALVNLVSSSSATQLLGNIHQYNTAPVYIVNPNGIVVGGSATLNVNNLILSTATASQSDWENMNVPLSSVTSGKISIAKGSSINAYGSFATQSHDLEVEDGVWFTVNPDANTTSSWSEGGATSNWNKGTVDLSATNSLSFAGGLNRASDSTGGLPIDVQLSAADITIKGTDTDGSGKLNLWGNASDAITLTGTNSITADKATLYSNGSLTLTSPTITALNGTSISAGGTKTASSTIKVDANTTLDGFTTALISDSGTTIGDSGTTSGDSGTTSGDSGTASGDSGTTATDAAAEEGMPQGGTLVTGGVTVTHSDATKTTSTKNLNNGDTVASNGATLINWDSYQLASGKTLTYQTDGGAIINRVIGADKTTLAGALKQYGSQPLYLINANGIAVGQGATIDANQLVLSGLDFDADSQLGNFTSGQTITLTAVDGKDGSITIDTGTPDYTRTDRSSDQKSSSICTYGAFHAVGKTVSIAPDTYIYIRPGATMENESTSSATPSWTQSRISYQAGNSATVTSDSAGTDVTVMSGTGNDVLYKGYTMTTGLGKLPASVTLAGDQVTVYHDSQKYTSGKILAYTDKADINIKAASQFTITGDNTTDASNDARLRADGNINVDSPLVTITTPTQIVSQGGGSINGITEDNLTTNDSYITIGSTTYQAARTAKDAQSGGTTPSTGDNTGSTTPSTGDNTGTDSNHSAQPSAAVEAAREKADTIVTPHIVAVITKTVFEPNQPAQPQAGRPRADQPATDAFADTSAESAGPAISADRSTQATTGTQAQTVEDGITIES